MLSFSLVAEALTGLIYHRPSGENSKFLPSGLMLEGICLRFCKAIVQSIFKQVASENGPLILIL